MLSRQTYPRSVLLALVIVSAVSAASVLIFTAYRDPQSPATNETNAASAQGATAPVPVAPADRAEFVDSAVELRWSWPALGPQQQFAVRLWYDDQEPRETWTTDSAFDAQDLIDSYARELGVFQWQVAVVNTADGGGFESMGSAWSAPQTLIRVRRLSITPLPDADQPDAARLIAAQDADTAADRIDAVRDFVWSHSDNAQQASYASDYSDALAMMVAHEQGAAARPQLLCDGQATAALTLLQALGLEARLIFLYSDNAWKIAEHTILEVFNPDTQRWELHDVYSNRYFVDRESNRTTIARLVFGDLDTVQICTPADDCTPLLDSDYGFTELFEAFRYGYSDAFWVNPDRFDVTKRFPENDERNLAEYLTGDPRDFVFRFDNWVRAH